MPARASRGFSLAEIVVVTAIAAVIASIALVALHPAIERSHQAACMGQLRQMHAAVMQYTADCDASEEVPGLGPLATGALHAGLRPLIPYLKSKQIRYCPDLPPGFRGKMATTYIWVPVPSRLIAQPSPGEAQMLRNQADEILHKGQEFPLWRCTIHDEIYYQPRESNVDRALSQPFLLEVAVSGSVSAGRRPCPRGRLLEGLASR